MRRLAAALLSALLAAAGTPVLGTAVAGCSRAAAGAPAAGAPAAGAPAAGAPAAGRADRADRVQPATAAPRGSAAGIAAAAHRHGPGCKMSCCVVRPAARPAAAAACGCRSRGSQPRQPAGFAAGMPSILPAPPRLPLPRGAALAWRRPELPAALPFLGIPERPPRA
jgi:hypothetical protein